MKNGGVRTRSESRSDPDCLCRLETAVRVVWPAGVFVRYPPDSFVEPGFRLPLVVESEALDRYAG